MYHIVKQRVGGIKGGRIVKVTIPCSDELSTSFTVVVAVVVVVVVVVAAAAIIDLSSEFPKLICRDLTL
jgi:hypothetical protein